jgi:hypothetical protein
MRRVILAIVATAAALVLLLSFKTHTQSPAPGNSPAAALGSPTPGGPTPGSPASGGSGSDAASPAGSSQGPGGTAGGGTARTVTGEAFQTVYGPVQVQVTVADGRIAKATALEYPQNTPRDQQINAYAIPRLDQEAVAAGSAKIDAVSGATYTSGGYIGSLQSALDQLNGA